LFNDSRAATRGERRSGMDATDAIPQKFVISHANSSKYSKHHFRPRLEMRDLGVAEATNGQISIYLSRATGPFVASEEPGTHYHNVRFQYFFVLKGWQRMYFKGHGEELLKPGTGWLQERGLVHRVLEQSPDFEVLVINMPHKFDTVDVDD
jgi:mannose-6-phosphate isomerase-like protein (cupin superfamily)